MSIQEITTLTFTPDNPTNTSVTTTSGDIVYLVVTGTSGKSTMTSVHNARNDVIGQLEWKSRSSDRVLLPGERPIAFSEWMQKSYVLFKDEASFKDELGRRYKWKGIGPRRCAELFSEHDKFRTVIARYTRSYRKPASSKPGDNQPGPSVEHTPEELQLTPRAKAVQDIVVLSLLFQEKHTRTKKVGRPMSESTSIGLMYGATVGLL